MDDDLHRWRVWVRKSVRDEKGTNPVTLEGATLEPVDGDLVLRDIHHVAIAAFARGTWRVFELVD